MASPFPSFILLLLLTVPCVSFTILMPTSRSVSSTTSTSLSFGIPKFLDPNNNNKDDKDDDDSPSKIRTGKNASKANPSAKKEAIGLSGIVQLITSGAGSPFLGDYKGVDEETGNFMFELEANNLTDEDGNSKQTQAKYFEEGWVDEDAEPFRFPWQKK